MRMPLFERRSWHKWHENLMGTHVGDLRKPQGMFAIPNGGLAETVYPQPPVEHDTAMK